MNFVFLQKYNEVTMKNNYSLLVLFLCMAVFFTTSCNENVDDENLDKTIISAFYFAENDSFPSIGSTAFYVNADTSFIYQGREYSGMIKNRDSMLYGTYLDTVSPVILVTYSVSHIKMIYWQKEKRDSLFYSDNDTLSFAEPVTLEVTSKDQKHKQIYLVQTNVHQIDHELYVWSEKSYPISQEVSSEKAFFFDGKIYFFVQTSSDVKLYTSSDAETWAEETLNGLPFLNVESLICTGKKFYVISENVLYTSVDGKNWESKSLSNTFTKMLFHVDDKAFAVMQKEGNSIVADVENEAVLQSYPEALLSEGISYISRAMPSGKTQCTVIGNGEVFATEDGEHWISLPNSANRKTPQRTYATAFFYDHFLFLFGGLENGNLSEKLIFSSDYGMTWNDADAKTDAFLLNSELQSSQKASIVVDDVNHNVYIIGGQGVSGEFLKKVWKGKKNETFFDNYK